MIQACSLTEGTQVLSPHVRENLQLIRTFTDQLKEGLQIPRQVTTAVRLKRANDLPDTWYPIRILSISLKATHFKVSSWWKLHRSHHIEPREETLETFNSSNFQHSKKAP